MRGAYLVDAAEWLARARHHLRWAAHDRDGGFFRESCFAAQQAAEVALKAVYLAEGQVPPRTHSLTVLLERCREWDEAAFGPLDPSCRRLSQFYVPTRYPDAAGPLPEFDPPLAEWAVGAAREVVAACEGYLRRRGLLRD